MKVGAAVSVVSHAALLAIILFGLSGTKELRPEAVDSIAVDLVPVEDVTNIRVGSLESKIVETPTPSMVKDIKPAEIAKPTGNTEEDQPKPEIAPKPTPAPTIKTAPAPQPDPEPDPVPTPTAQPTPVEPAPRPEPPKAQQAEPAPAPTPEPTPQPDPTPAAQTPELTTPTETQTPQDVAPAPAQRVANLEQKRAEFKKQQEAAQKAAEDAKKKAEEEAKRVAEAKKKEEQAKKEADAKKQQQAAVEAADRISSIINNEQSRGGTTGQGGEPTLGKPTGSAARLSQSELDALVAQIRSCLAVAPGAVEAAAMVRLRIDFTVAGSVQGNPQITSNITTPIEQALANAAIRAVVRCGPYSLVAQRYDELKQIEVNFDPAQF